MSEEYTHQCRTCNVKISGEAAAVLHMKKEHPAPSLQPLDKASIKLVPIPHRAFQRGPAGASGPPSLIPPDRNSDPEHSHIVQLGNDGPSARKMVVVKHNGVHVPFYLSSGAAGKDDPNLPEHKRVAAGKWYPHFGMGEPSMSPGWINKGTTDQIKNHYGSPELAHIASVLDTKIGDIRNSTDHPIVSGVGPERDFINSHVSETPAASANPSKDPEGHGRFYRNVQNITRALEASRRTNA